MPKSRSPPQNTKPFHLSHPLFGHIEGITHTSPSNPSRELCHYFGGIPYALPPLGPYRFRRPRSLPPCYRYGTKASPGRFNAGCGVCPQPAGFSGSMNADDWDEDCLQLNIWIPAGERPEKGWPVFFYLHGGFLQFGTPNTHSLISLLSSTSCQCIVVLPAYRLNLFGFLASRELLAEAHRHGEDSVGNLGFWDQRMALEWTYRNISYFGGDADEITVGGHSAGAHSTFHLLAHSLYLNSPNLGEATTTSASSSISTSTSRESASTQSITKKLILKRALLISNGPGLPPKPLSQLQPQFDSLLDALHIPLSLTSTQKLARLRALPAKTLLLAAGKLEFHEFRACGDTSTSSYIQPNLFHDINTGTFARRLKEAGVEIVIGEVKDEHHVYSLWRPPQNNYTALRHRLCADYPPAAIDALLSQYYCPNKQLPTLWGANACADWGQAFGRIYADLQVHALQRGLVEMLAKHGAGHLLRRYRIEWRARCVGRSGVPQAWGVTHGTDMTGVWLFGEKAGGLDITEARSVTAFAEPVWSWMMGAGLPDVQEWAGKEGARQVRLLGSDGQSRVWQDEWLEDGARVWEIARRAIEEDAGWRRARL